MNDQSQRPQGYIDQAAFDAACRACDEFAGANPSLDKQDLLLILIELCIEAGANTERSIIAAIDQIGRYTTKHIAFILKAEAGSDPSGYRWCEVGTKTYALH